MSATKIRYCYVTVPNRPGQGVKVLGELKSAKLNLLAYSGFPTKSGNSQLDLVAKKISPIQRIAKKNGWKVSGVKKGFLIQGRDRVGAVHDQIRKLAGNNINVTAADAVVTGRGRYGMLIWVKNKDYARASRALKAR